MKTNAQNVILQGEANALPQVPKSLDNKPRRKDNETADGGKTAGSDAGTIKATDELREHILRPEPYKGGEEIKGGHEKSAFLKELGKVGGKVVKTTPSTQIDGVETIEYALPKYDKAGKSTGEFRSKPKIKTIFDLNKMNVDEYISRGLEAANEALKNSKEGLLGNVWIGTDKNGVKWKGYFGNGIIKSFYPID